VVAEDGFHPRGSEVRIVVNIFWTEKNIFDEADCRRWSGMGSPRGWRWGIVVNIFWTEKNIFWRGGLPMVIEHGVPLWGSELAEL